jgi:cation diffusion facilitator CzcD-associated flavoprotein CzcO
MVEELDDMTGRPTYDAVVVGAGPNGLAASVELASAVERILERGYPIGERRITVRRSRCTSPPPTATA